MVKMNSIIVGIPRQENDMADASDAVTLATKVPETVYVLNVKGGSKKYFRKSGDEIENIIAEGSKHFELREYLDWASNSGKTGIERNEVLLQRVTAQELHDLREHGIQP
jgi:hypothetical protein